MTPAPLTHSLLDPCPHGFFTREGGVSQGLHASLNCGETTDDSPDAVQANRARVAASLGLPPLRLLTARQTHSATVISVTHGNAGRTLSADGLVTNEPGLGIGVLTADCQPILMVDREEGVIAAIHAGWRGTVAGIIEAGIAAMETLGARRNTIEAVIGPAISQGNFEVGGEVRAAATEHAAWTGACFARNGAGRYQMDLKGMGVRILHNERIGKCAMLDHCTYDEEERFFSWRRTTHRRQSGCGLMLAAIALET